MFPGTIVYVYTGTELSKIESLSGVAGFNSGIYREVGLLPIVSKTARLKK